MLLSAVRTAASELPVEALERAIAAGSFMQAEPLIDAAIEALEDAIRGGPPATRGFAAAAAGKDASATGIIADAMKSGAVSSPVCVRAPSKDAQVDAVQNYVGDSSPVNVPLRSGGTLNRTSQEIADGLDALLADNKLAGRTRVYRVAEKSEAWKGLEAGDEFVDRGFVSTTKSRGSLPELQEALGIDPDETVLFNIMLPEGTPAIDVNAVLPKGRNFFPEQQEILLGRGHTFVIDGVKVMEDGHLQVFMRLIR